MPFAPTLTHESKAVPGVTFTVHRIGLGRRTDIDILTLKLRQRMRELEADHPSPSEAETALSEALAIAERKLDAVPPDEKSGVLDADVKPILKELAAAIPPEVVKQRAVLNEEYRQVHAQLQAVWIRSGLVAVAGGEFDGMTADQLLASGPPALAAEVYEALINDGWVRGSAVPNSQSPSTSGAVAGGVSLSTTAGAAATPPAAGT